MKAARATRRMAARLVYSPHRGQRLRLLLLTAVAAVTAMVALLAVGVVHSLFEERERFDARAVRMADDGQRPVVRVNLRSDTWGTEQFPVVWLEPVKAGDRAALPPGMADWPEPGGWYVSPGLAELAADEPRLAERFPRARVLGSEGVLNPGELLAYRLMPRGGTMGVDVLEATGFGGGRPGQSMPIGEDDELDVPAMTLAVAGFAGVPLLLLALTATGVSAPLRSRRMALLGAIGLPGRWRRRLLVYESLLITGPGLVAGTVLWAVAGSLLDRVPVVDHRVADNALIPPYGAVLLTVLALAALFTGLSLAADRVKRGRRGQTSPRPRAGRPALSELRLAPAVAGVCLLVTASVREGETAAVSALAATVTLAAGVPLALPVVARRLAARSAAGAVDPVRVMAARRLQYDPRSAVKPLYGIAALLVVVPVVAAWMASARQADPPAPRDRYVESVLLRGALAQLDLKDFTAPVPGAVAARIHTLDPSDERAEPAFQLGADCSALTTLLGAPSCERPGVLLPRAAERLTRIAGLPVPLDLALRPPPEPSQLSKTDTLLILGERRPGFEPDVRTAALTSPLALTVLSENDLAGRESKLVGWIFGGLTLLAVQVFCTLAIGVIDRSAAGRRDARLLISFGLTGSRVREIAGREFLMGYVMVVGIGLGTGVVASAVWNSLDAAVPYPTDVTVLTVVVATLLGALGLMSVRAQRDEPA
ncbi:FtsX-like permease family protein [Streptomyces sp. NPDC059477]|uniref:FtsX-like permease family protein n=1 Tax=Streptomyces sp. NPDC059477 TaxID=3346847 RepID=UPI003689761C